MSSIDYDQLETAYTEAKFGSEEPTLGLMPEPIYWALVRYFHPEIKLPRKMKKRLFGTRRRRRHDEQAIRRAFSGVTQVNMQMSVEDIQVRYVPGSTE